MSNAVFPALPGLKLEMSKSPMWSTRVKASANGREVRSQFYSSPIWRFVLSYEVLRITTATSELDQIIGFFNARQGSYDTFLYSDLHDNEVTDQAFAVVATGQNSYPLVRTLGGFVEPIGAVDGLPVIKANGTTVSAANYTISDNGVVTFSVLPTVGAVLTWTGSFFYRCRFIQDSLEFSKFTRDLWGAKKIEFQSVKP
jgi:uncharacterized protein (TIGR02217 family)